MLLDAFSDLLIRGRCYWLTYSLFLDLTRMMHAAGFSGFFVCTHPG